MTLQSSAPADAPAVDDGRFSIAGKVAVVTGANSGLGRTIALGLLDAGAFVVGTGRDESKNASFRQELGSNTWCSASYWAQRIAAEFLPEAGIL